MNDETNRLLPIHELSVGPFGSVWICADQYDPVAGRVWVVKYMSKHMNGYKDWYPKQEIECHVLSAAHTHVMPLHFVLETSSHWCLVMQHAKGGDLFERLCEEQSRVKEQGGDITAHWISTVLRWYRQIVEAVAFCHCKGIMHRDIKPENILLSTSNDDADAWLADFGYATSATYSTCSVGTSVYLCPQRARLRCPGTDDYQPQMYTVKTDVWQLGMLLYECVTLHSLPVQACRRSDDLSVLKWIAECSEAVRLPNNLALPETVADLLQLMLHADEEKRADLSTVLNHPLLKQMVT